MTSATQSRARFIGILAALAAVVCVWPSAAVADVEILSPSADTTLNEASPNNNHGEHPQILVGTDGPGRLRRGLLQFNIAGEIPAGSVIQSATLYITANGANANSGGFDLHRMLIGWGEGTGSGAMGSPATPGAATWNNRFHGTTPWGAAGGLAGTDYIAAASSSQLVSAPAEYAFAGLASDVQAMLDDSASNFGWMLLSSLEGTTQTARQFEASDTFSNSPPRLEIEYAAIPEPGTLSLLAVGGLLIGTAAVRRRRNR